MGESNKYSLNISQVKVLAEIRNNSNITKPQLMVKCELDKTALLNNKIYYLNKKDVK